MVDRTGYMSLCADVPVYSSDASMTSYWHKQAVACQKSQDIEGIIYALTKALEFQPDSIPLRTALVESLYLKGRFNEVREMCNVTLKQAPESAVLWKLLALVQNENGEADKAELSYRKVLAFDSKDFLAHHNIALLALGRKAVDEALLYFKRALALVLDQKEFNIKISQSLNTGFDYQGAECLLWETLVQLASAGVHAFVIAGALLGLIREGKLLPFDKDLDIALPFSEMKHAVQCLQGQGWILKPQALPLINPVALVHKSTGITLDLCGVIPEKATGLVLGGLWLSGVPIEWLRVTEYPSVELVSVKRPEGVVWQLSEPERWLEALYGDWKTPDPFFDSVICANNQRGFSILSECIACNRMITLLREGKYKKVMPIARYCFENSDDVLYKKVFDAFDWG
ncbi:MAG: hypothetical protein OIF57_06375 [Marinobacterium sp.]|nr:hypothetical protein [Marinobacterium sp.]